MTETPFPSPTPSVSESPTVEPSPEPSPVTVTVTAEPSSDPVAVLWPDGGQELATAAVLALCLILLFVVIHVVADWGRA